MSGFYVGRLFDIVGLMKGHVGGGSGSDIQGVSNSVKAKPFYSDPPKLALVEFEHVSLHIHSICDVQERLLEMSGFLLGFSPGVVVEHQT